MSPAVDQRRDAHTRRLAPNVERAHALGAVDQVSGARQEIDSRRFDVHRNLPDRLRRVGVEDDPLVLGQLSNRRHVLDRADLVVREHDRDEDRLVRDRLANRVELHQTVRPHGHVRRLEALPLQALTDVQARPLLDGGGDDVVALFPVHLGDALDREIDRLGPPGSEDDFLGIPGADDLRDLIPRAVDGVLGLPAERVVPARRVAELLGEVGNHRLDDPWVYGRRRLRIHENRELQHLALSVSPVPCIT